VVVAAGGAVRAGVMLAPTFPLETSVAAAEARLVAESVAVDPLTSDVLPLATKESVAVDESDAAALAVPLTALVSVPSEALVSVLLVALVSVPLRQEQVETSGVCPKGQVPGSPNGTIGMLGDPYRPGSTPSS